MKKTKPRQAAAPASSEGASPVTSRRKAKFGLFGEEMIEKKVRACGRSGRVYLPPEWVGKNVKIIRLD
jgi:putative transposon-encoded protein